MHHYEEYETGGCNNLDGGKLPRSTPDPYLGIPSGYLTVPIGKGCVLLLTRTEYARGLKRGKTWRRRQARTTRQGERSDASKPIATKSAYRQAGAKGA